MKRLRSLLMIAVILLGIFSRPLPARAANTYHIKVNRQQNCVTVYKKDTKGRFTVPVKAFACSVGVNNATPTGSFSVGSKYRWHLLDGDVWGQYCTRITGRVLFHSVFYHDTDPSTLYYNSYNRLGTTASHGCVRLCVADAKWIYDNCSSGTTVEIYDSSDPGPLGKPTPIRINTSSQYRGWDPTDPDPNNPWPKSAPKITGAKNRTLERCSSVKKLTSGVKAEDFAGNALKVKVSGKYNLDKVGKYKITYKAVDARGKSTKKTVTITVKDTKKPTVSLKKKELELTDDEWDFYDIDELRVYLKKYVTAKDNGKSLAAKYIHMSVGTLWEAWENSEYGDYKVKVYAKDASGNKSKVKTITVHYVDPYAEEETGETGEPENPGGAESTGSTGGAESTGSPAAETADNTGM
ncbi:MAG: L,D-transpeptidase family protein [Roseburia sp.]|nr:L,D-transpeptidase family protein [Roseburia sp.]MCM1430206.1 L,D-transpeptidase family protein [Muribaculaceae bacterium]